MLAAGTQLLGVKAKMIGVAQRLFKNKTRLLQIARARQAFNIPERTGGKCSLAPRSNHRERPYLAGSDKRANPPPDFFQWLAAWISSADPSD